MTRIKKNHEKNRTQGQISTDRLSHSLQQIGEVSHILCFFFFNTLRLSINQKAEKRVTDSKLEYEQVSKLVKQEVARFEQERINDFKNALHTFLEGMISRQKDVSHADNQ